MIAILIYIVATVILCGLAILVASYFRLWLQAYFTGTRISLLDLMLMSLRKSNPRVGSAKKLHRWIGSVQDAMLANRIHDLDELQSKFDEAKHSHWKPVKT